jgi:hypothetical protein
VPNGGLGIASLKSDDYARVEELAALAISFGATLEDLHIRKVEPS